MKNATLAFLSLLYISAVTQFPYVAHANGLETEQVSDHIDLSNVKVMFKLKVFGLARIKGRFDRLSGSMMNDNNGDPYSVSMRIDVSSINTNDEDRDDFLRGPAFFAAEHYPHIMFQGHCQTLQADGRARLIGVLQLRGYSKQIAFDIEAIEKDGGINGYQARARIKRSDFGLNSLKLIVSDDVEIVVAM